MRLRALVLAAGLVWPVSAFSETATRDATFLVFALIYPLSKLL
jgi:hypothetical protein